MDFRYVIKDSNRHGRVRYYYRAPGAKKVRLPDDYGSAVFKKAYLAASRGETLVTEVPQQPHVSSPVTRTIKTNSLRWLVTKYLDSSDFKRLDPRNAAYTRRYLEAICQSRDIATGRARGELLYSAVKRSDVVAIRDTIHESAYMANFHLKKLGTVFNWAMKNDLAMVNPVSLVDKLKTSKKKGKAWTQEDFETFERNYPLGSKERTAYAIMRFTIVRLSDCIRLGPQHLHKGCLNFTEYKGGHSKVIGRYAPVPKDRTIRIVPELQQALDAAMEANTAQAKKKGSNVTQLTFLTTPTGKQFSEENFSIWWRKRLDDIGLNHCTAHGVRRGVAKMAAERGASGHMLMSMGGWTNLKQVQTYTEEVDRLRLTNEGLELVRATKR